MQNPAIVCDSRKEEYNKLAKVTKFYLRIIKKTEAVI